MRLPRIVHPGWVDQCPGLFSDERVHHLLDRVKGGAGYPVPARVFAPFAVPPDQVKLIIMGLAPYNRADRHGRPYATGNAFAIPNDSDNRPSLEVIRRSLAYNYMEFPGERLDNELTCWTEQGVLLLNAALTVPLHGNPRSNLKKWEWFYHGLFDELERDTLPRVLACWGRDAGALERLAPGHWLVTSACHPAATARELTPTKSLDDVPGSRNLAAYHPFEKINRALRELGLDQIEWWEGFDYFEDGNELYWRDRDGPRQLTIMDLLDPEDDM